MKLRLAAIAASLLAVLAVGLLGWAYWASRQVPEFYQEALELKPEVQRIANDELLEQATALASDVRKEGQWQALFTADQINGWLAVDLARNYPDLLPAGSSDPRVLIRSGSATVACRYKDRTLDTVVSLDLEVYLNEPNVVSLRLRNARAGAIPVPLGKFLDRVAAAADARIDLRWLQAEGDPVAVVTLLPPRDDEDRLYQLESLELREGEVYVAGRTICGNSEGSPVWDPQFEPVASAAVLTSDKRHR